MSAIPANLARVPNLLASRIALGGIQGTNRELLQLQIRLASGKEFTRPSENAIGASTVTVLDDAIERRDQRLRNLSQADATLNALDAALADVSDLLQEAKGIGLSQVGVGSDEATRRNQAAVIDSMLNSLIGIANRDLRGIHFFGGDEHAAAPFSSLLQGIRYTGSGTGMRADLGMARDVRMTMGAEQAFGALSGRVEGDRDLDPRMTTATRLADLRGANGTGVKLGAIEVEVNGTAVAVDLSDADSVGDVITRLNAAIQPLDAGATVAIDAVLGDRFAITPSAGTTLVIRDSNASAASAAGASTTGGDLGLTGTFAGGVTGTGRGLDPKLVELTRLDSLSGMTLPLGEILIRNGGQSRRIDLGALDTVQDFQNAVAAAGIGVRVEISEDGTRLNVRNELSGALMSVEELGGATASELGIRSFASTTKLADFNGGQGVRQSRGNIDPSTGLPDPAADRDLRVTLKDGRNFEVDIEGDETVADVLASINAAAVAAGVSPTDFEARLVSNGNGLEIFDGTTGGSTTIADINNSSTATDLGLAGTTTAATLSGTDRATVAVDSVFSHLMALRDALLANDSRGIEFATGRLESDLDRATEARGDVGVRSRRVADATGREEELGIQDMALRSSIQDLDFTAAATRFASLQQQLEAGLAGASRAVNLSLLDFLR
jgi:flagellar hook-associated protein 3 FlgL